MKGLPSDMKTIVLVLLSAIVPCAGKVVSGFDKPETKGREGQDKESEGSRGHPDCYVLRKGDISFSTKIWKDSERVYYFDISNTSTNEILAEVCYTRPPVSLYVLWTDRDAQNAAQCVGMAESQYVFPEAESFITLKPLPAGMLPSPANTIRYKFVLPEDAGKSFLLYKISVTVSVLCFAGKEVCDRWDNRGWPIRSGKEVEECLFDETKGYGLLRLMSYSYSYIGPGSFIDKSYIPILKSYEKAQPASMMPDMPCIACLEFDKVEYDKDASYVEWHRRFTVLASEYGAPPEKDVGAYLMKSNKETR